MAQVGMPAEIASARSPYLEWGPVLAGAVAASAVSFLLLTFGAAIGLSMTSPWPNAGVSTAVVALAVAWWAVMVQIGSFFAGGYLVGRMRSRWGESVVSEGQFRDGAHGFLVWAVGVLFGALLLASTGASVLKTASQSGATVAAGVASGAAPANAMSPTNYAVDTLLRPAATPASNTSASQPNGASDSAIRAEAARIFAETVKNGEFTAKNRDYLTQVVMSRTGLSQPEAQRQVDQSVEEIKNIEIKARDQANKARKAALITGFLAAASLLISAGAAVAGAGLGGKHRDEGTDAHVFGHRIW